MICQFNFRTKSITLLIVVVSVAMVASVGCTRGDMELPPSNETTVDSPHGKVHLEYDGSIGAEDMEGYFFSFIRGIEIDQQDNIVVYDAGLKNIRVYSPTGTLIRAHELAEGPGPGEFTSGTSGFSLSEDKQRILLYNYDALRVTVLDYTTFDYINSFRLDETDYAKIDAGPDNTIMAVYTQRTLGQMPLIYRFTEQGTKLAAFSGRHSRYGEFWDRELQFAHEVSFAQSDSFLFVSFSLPYDIRVYNRRHELVNRFHRRPEYFGGEVQEGEWLYPSGYCTNIVVADNELVLQVVVNKRDDEKWVHAFDFAGRDRGVQNMLGGEWGDNWYLDSDAVDSRGNVYGVAFRPFPRVIRLRVVSGER